MIIREYNSTDCKEITQLFYNTVHSINAKDYTQAQLDAWAPATIDMERFDTTLSHNFTVVILEHDVIIGFGDIDDTGYLDHLFVHKEYQKQGVAKGILKALEQHALQHDISTVTTHASITARPFFELFGYQVLKEQLVERFGQKLTNFVMEKLVIS